VLTAKPPLSFTAPAPVALAAWLCCAAPLGVVYAQGAAPASAAPAASESSGASAPSAFPSPKLKTTPLLIESLREEAARQAPTFLFADSVRGRTDLETVLEGRAVLRKHSTSIRADRLEYYQPDDRVKATGNVRLNRNGNVFEGPQLELRVDAFEGFLASPRFEFLKNSTHGQAERVDFLDTNRAVVKNTWLTSCRKDPAADMAKAWLPDWVLQAASIKLDTENDEGVATGGVLRFKGAPLLAVPALSFPLSDARRSGFLPPSFNLDNISGFELTQPYYMNIAPNRDATLEPTYRSRRGLDIGAEFRYLDPQYKGVVRTSWMPYDSLRGTSRWSLSNQHESEIDIARLGFRGASDAKPNLWNLGWNINRVSDNNFWRDFPRSGTTLTQRLLPADVVARHYLYLGKLPVGIVARTLTWQTLQDPDSAITPPYDRLPQVTVNFYNQRIAGFDWEAAADFTRFHADRTLTGQPNTSRAVVSTEVSRTWGGAAYSITPKLKANATSYQFDAPLADGRRSAQRAVPTFSLDAGMAFERDTSFGGKAYVQTLEPRAFYVRTPFRDQSNLPNYDSGLNDFNFATIYTENAFGGNDRISDANLLTLGATTRWLNAQTGAEAVRLAIAQRLRFDPQRVTLPGDSVVDERVSDLLLGASVHAPSTTFDTTIQYSQKLRQSVRGTVGVRYAPGPYQTLNVAYRLQRDQSEQVDMSWQWPLGKVAIPGIERLIGPRADAAASLPAGRWYSVGRLNYSVLDRRLVDAVLGVEYDADCWLARFVLERLQRGVPSSTGGPESSKRILFQLEFVGFSRVGNNPLSALQKNIPRYQVLREKTTTPSRFTNYE
jgi:LPS-assembly protein